MALMNLNIDGVLTVEKVVVPADGITVLGHSLFRGEKIIVRYNGDELTRGQDFIPDRIDDRLYFQKNVCLFTILKILNESLLGQEIEVEYFACGDYINAEIWNEYPSVASLKQSLASKVDNSDFIKEVKRIDGDINAEATARKEADNALQDNINTETNLRIAEDEKLQTNINNEATARADADNALQDNINKEAAARESADNEIRNELSSETDLRLAGDAVLQEKINAEMSTRAENDSSLQSQILDLKTKFENFVPGLTYKVVSSLPTADILNDVIYLVPADSTGSQSVYDEYIYIDGDWELIGTTATTQAITVDSALSSTSTNPVQNKVITMELENMSKSKAIADFNSKTFKIDITKGNENWNGNMKFGYCVDRSYGEIIISSLGTTTVEWSSSTGLNYVKSVTYTIDSTNKAHVTIGVELYDVVYGVHQVEAVGDFAKINSFTADIFAGASVAKRGSVRGRNNGTGILSNVAELGLTTPCTVVEIAQAMTEKVRETDRIPASGMIGIFDSTRNKITDAPSDCGLLQINTYGYDRIMIRYDGIAGTNYTGSWIGMVKGGEGIFNEIIWEKLLTEANIDSALSETSTNPVQNKVIAGEISTLKSKTYSQEITGYTVKNSSYYKDPGVVMNMWKKNGIAFINLQVQCLSPSNSNRIFIEGLPPAAISLYFEVQLNNDSNKLHVSIDTSGNLLLSDGTQNNIYRVAFSYPIDD